MIKVYQDRDWLWEQYIARGKSSHAVAKEANCNYATIYNWLHKLDIPTHISGGLWRNEGWLYKHYIAQKESAYAMAKEAGCADLAIYTWLRKYKIPIRSSSEGIFLATKNSVDITPDLLEFMEGEITGDGCVRMPNNRSACYRHSSKYKEYIIWLSGCLNEWGIEQSGRITRYKDKKTGAIGYHYESRYYPELVPIYKRWYSKRDGKMKKTVPEGFKLTSIRARQWYLGDGGFDSYKRKHPGIKLATCDFDRQSVEYLIKELNGLGFKATYQPSENTIRIWVRSVPDFLSWIGPCPVSCYYYKWGY